LLLRLREPGRTFGYNTNNKYPDKKQEKQAKENPKAGSKEHFKEIFHNSKGIKDINQLIIIFTKIIKSRT